MMHASCVLSRGINHSRGFCSPAACTPYSSLVCAHPLTLSDPPAHPHNTQCAHIRHQVPVERIRNFCIIAHIDHGESQQCCLAALLTTWPQQQPSHNCCCVSCVARCQAGLSSCLCPVILWSASINCRLSRCQAGRQQHGQLSHTGQLFCFQLLKHGFACVYMCPMSPCVCLLCSLPHPPGCVCRQVDAGGPATAQDRDCCCS